MANLIKYNNPVLNQVHTLLNKQTPEAMVRALELMIKLIRDGYAIDSPIVIRLFCLIMGNAKSVKLRQSASYFEEKLRDVNVGYVSWDHQIEDIADKYEEATDVDDILDAIDLQADFAIHNWDAVKDSELFFRPFEVVASQLELNDDADMVNIEWMAIEALKELDAYQLMMAR